MANYIRRILKNYVVLDLETTGLSKKEDKIIEIGILKVKNDEIVDKYSTLINPEVNIDNEIQNLTGITNEMVKNKPLINEIKNDVLDFIGKSTIIGHNTSFDIGFIEENFGKIENNYIDTVQFSRKLFDTKNHKLSTLREYLNLNINSHRSIDDCVTTKELYDCIKKEMKNKNLKVSDIFGENRTYELNKKESSKKTVIKEKILEKQNDKIINETQKNEESIYQQMNKKTKLIITILFGMFGIHKFIDKKYLIGFIYLITLGIFYIGWILDIYKLIKEK